MKTIRMMAVAVAVLFAGSGLAPHMAQAQSRESSAPICSATI